MTGRTKTEQANGHGDTSARDERRVLVEERVHELLANCPYKFYFSKVQWKYEKGTLKLNGSVPTFHMKQILQTLLRDTEHVSRIVNDVDVVSSTGLSSVRPK